MGRKNQPNEPKVPYIASGRPMRPSLAINAKPLDEQSLLWLIQPEEPKDYYEAFIAWRDQENRGQGKNLYALFDTEEWKAKGWTSKKAAGVSSVWSWSWRDWHWQRYLGTVETEELVKYRRTMARRHRDVSRAALGKAIQWLANMDPNTMKPLEAIRMMEVATAIEREASGANQLELGMPGSADQPPQDPATKPGTLADLAGIDPTVRADLAEALHRITSGAEKGTPPADE